MVFAKLLISAIILFLLLSCIQAQKIAFGLKGGADTGTPYSKPKEGASGKLGKGGVFGAFLKHEFGKHFNIRFELFYSYKSASFVTPISGDTVYAKTMMGNTYYIPTSYSGIARGTFKNEYLNLPVFLAYKAGKKFNFLAGPQVSYLLKGNNTGTADVNVGADPNYPYTTVKDKPFDQSGKLNKWDYEVTCGVMFEAAKRLNFDLNFSYGLRSIYNKGYKNAGGTVRNIYLQLTLDFLLGRINKDADSEMKKNTPTQ